MKKCILLQKIAFFSLFCELQTMKMEFSATFLQLSYVVIYLSNYLNLEKSCLKIHFHFLQFTKKAEKAIFWSEIQFFCKRYSLRSQTFLSVFQTCQDTLYPNIKLFVDKNQLFVYLCNLGCLQWSRPTAFDFFSTTQLFSLNRRPR